jgi:hypothetical protein
MFVETTVVLGAILTCAAAQMVRNGTKAVLFYLLSSMTTVRPFNNETEAFEIYTV